MQCSRDLYEIARNPLPINMNENVRISYPVATTPTNPL